MIAFNTHHHGASGTPGVHPHPGHHGMHPGHRAAGGGMGTERASHSHPPPTGIHPLGPGKESGGYDSMSQNTATVSPEGKVT
jgi:hypothetical protein